MADGYEVDHEVLREHASNLERFQERFQAIKDASSHIAQDDEAYGLLCGWIAGILEERHQRQDGLVDYLEENISLAASSIRDAADAYEASDNDSALSFQAFETDLEG